MSLVTRQEVVNYAESKAWKVIYTSDCEDVFGTPCKGGDKFVFVEYYPDGGLSRDEQSLVIPYKGIMVSDEVDENGELLQWWFDGNEGNGDEWWDSLPEDQK